MIHESADVDESATVHSSASIWHLAQVRENARVGANTTVGRCAYIGAGVVVGSSCKIQNLAMVYEPAFLEDGVFIGPGAILTNDRHPRAVNADGCPKSRHDWSPVGVRVLHGASIGAGAICVAPVTIGQWAFVAAGAVVARDVPAFALVAGNPARRIGWVGKLGARLSKVEGHAGLWCCPVSRALYRETDHELLEEHA